MHPKLLVIMRERTVEHVMSEHVKVLTPTKRISVPSSDGKGSFQNFSDQETHDVMFTRR